MPIELISAVEDILMQVEERTGKAIQAVEQKDLPMLAELRMAAKDDAMHCLFHRPSYDEQINYIIANQCGHILRLFGVPEDQRFMPVANYRTMMSYVMEMGNEFHRLEKAF